MNSYLDETSCILAYDENCFCIKRKGLQNFFKIIVKKSLSTFLQQFLSMHFHTARNPDVPFGKTFVAWTQILVENTGSNACKLTCSVEPEFPNGEPMVSADSPIYTNRSVFIIINILTCILALSCLDESTN